MDAYQKHFEKRLEDLERFHKKEKRWPTLYSEDEQEKSLGVWCHKQRLAHSKGTLAMDRIKLLSDLHFPLAPMDEKWNEAFQKLKAYIKKYHSLPGTTDANYSFSYRQYKGFDRLAAEKKERLNEIGFLPLWQEHVDGGKWKEHFEKLKIFVQAYGRLPTRKTERNLEYWVNTQRQLMKKGVLHEDQLVQFKKAGINLLERSFSKDENRFDKRLEELKIFLHTHQRLPGEVTASERPLRIWLYHQERSLKEGRLTNERLQQLRALGLSKFPCRRKRKGNWFSM